MTPSFVLLRLAQGLLVFLALVVGPAGAHEVRPAYLEVTAAGGGTYDVLFKTPMVGEMRLALNVVFGSGVDAITPVLSRAGQDAMVQTWRIKATAGSLAGSAVRIAGLETTLSDALLRVEEANGKSWVHRLSPSAPLVVLPVADSSSGVARTYLALGVEHILLGYDHLLFVLALMLLTAGWRPLIKAVTAFTAAHSITLAVATLGFVHVPPKPVEAVIALSIVLLAAEIVRARRGHASLSTRMPWLVAFTFGLLHGFGFAGALSEIGMPAGFVPIALFFFNLGVEAGQLLFVLAVSAAALAFGYVVHRSAPRWTGLVPPYAIGSLAMFWVIQRIAAF